MKKKKLQGKIKSLFTGRKCPTCKKQFTMYDAQAGSKDEALYTCPNAHEHYGPILFEGS